jgi:hypothetical protein
VSLYSPIGNEMGPGFVLPNGNAFFLGGSGHTALYTPSGDTNFGKWVVGPDIPNGLTAADAPAAMMRKLATIHQPSAHALSGGLAEHHYARISIAYKGGS